MPKLVRKPVEIPVEENNHVTDESVMEDELPVDDPIVSSEISLVRIVIDIEGIPPGIIFQGKGLMKADETEGKRVAPRSPQEEAELRAHWMTLKGKKVMCIPWVMIYNSICKAGADFKAKGRKTMQSLLAPTISCEVEKISLGTDQFETFVEYCKIPPRTGAMVEIGRPKLSNWSCTVPMLADCEAYNPHQLEAIVKHAGKNVGIGAWRPQLKGPYGRFKVTRFEVC